MIVVVEEYIPDGHDCWGRSEFKLNYSVYKDRKLIEEFPFDPSNFLNELGIEYTKECYD